MLQDNGAAPSAILTGPDMSTNPQHASSHPSPPARRDVLRVVAITLAVAGQAVVAVPFTAASGLLAPLWGVAIAWVLWVASAVALVLVARRRPFAAPLVPVANAALLWLLITIGGAVFGWTA